MPTASLFCWRNTRRPKRGYEMATAGIDAIFEVQGVTRAARSYAFLYAAFKRSEVTNSPVRDAVDCLVPFIIPFLNQRGWPTN